MAGYEDMTSEDFERHLLGVLSLMSHEQILAIPGVYEVLSEELNNEVLESWDQEQKDKARG